MQAQIEILGLGAGDIEQLPLGIYEKLINTKKKIYVRTKDHPVLTDLEARGLNFESFDYLYEQEENFEQVYEKVVHRLIELAREQAIIYAVPGHPMLAEKTVQDLLQADVPVQVLGGQSYLDDLFTSLKIDPIEGFQFIDATSFQREQLNYDNHIIFSQVYDSFTASNVKLALLEDLPPEFEVTLVEAAGSRAEKIQTIPLVELDRQVTVSNLLSVYIPPVPKNLLNHTFSRLREVIAYLRGPEGCPWDRKQTHQSLKPYLLEETYELLEAIDAEDDVAITEELGDVLLQVMLHSQIGEDDGYFSIDDVILSITDKMIHRHPQVFGAKEDQHKTWEQLKQEERGDMEEKTSLMAPIPQDLPALFRAEKIQKQAAKLGFDWENVADVWEKFKEELAEVEEAIESKNEAAIFEEFGDLLFVTVNLLRFYDLNAEFALQACNEKFLRRFRFVEEKVVASGRSFEEMTLEELDHYWDLAKEGE